MSDHKTLPCGITQGEEEKSTQVNIASIGGDKRKAGRGLCLDKCFADSIRPYLGYGNAYILCRTMVSCAENS